MSETRALQEGEDIGRCGAFGRWIASKGWDIDELFAYETVKIVRVRDYKLGMINYAFQLGIVLYLIIYGLIISRGYLKTEELQAGSVLLNAKAPPRISRLNQNLLPYCCNTTGPCDNDSRLVLPCLYYDEYQAEYPVGKDYSTMVTSRITFTEQTVNQPGCSFQSFNSDCAYEGDTQTNYFVAQAENFTLRIRHAVRGSTVKREGANSGSNAMKGELKFADGSVRVWPDDQLWYGQPQNETRNGDIVSVGELLEASGLGSGDAGADGATVRYDGLNVIVYIRYQMSGASSLKYTYEPRALSSAEFKVEQTVYSEDQSTRTIYNRHGVRIIFVAIGTIGEFDFLALMTTLVTGLALLAVATTVTNMLMSYLMSMRMVYNKHKYETTEDFSSWRSMSAEEKARRLEILAHTSEGGTTHTSAALGLGHAGPGGSHHHPWKPADCDSSDDEDDKPTATTTFHAPAAPQAAPQGAQYPTAYPQQQQYPPGQYNNGYPPVAYPAGPYGGSVA
eukprot:m.77603 g.77603  ORF g.77603 m.77603 type:complete len:506 (+) comp14474_c0_seq1:119-1636(+)